MDRVSPELMLFYNEDCISGAQRFLADGSVDLIITDPPYGIDGDLLHRHYNRKEEFVTGGYVEIPREEYAAFSGKWISEAERILRPGGSLYVVSGYTNLFYLLKALMSTNLVEVNHLVWRYSFGVFTRNKYVSSHYHILYWSKPGGKRTFNTEARFGLQEKREDGRSRNYSDREDVWLIDREYKPGMVKNKNELPLGLLVKMIQYSSNEGDLVCDLFLGGFSTARAAIGLNRRACGFEISPEIFKRRETEIRHLVPGFLLDRQRKPTAQPSENRRARWTPDERENLIARFRELTDTNLSKKAVIMTLCAEFGRGEWGIRRALLREER